MTHDWKHGDHALIKVRLRSTDGDYWFVENNQHSLSVHYKELRVIEEFKPDGPANTVDMGVHERLLREAREDAWVKGAAAMKAVMVGIVGAAVDFTEHAGDDWDASGLLDSLVERIKEVEI